MSKRSLVGTGQVGSEVRALETGRRSVVGNRAEMLDEMLQYLERARVDTDELHSEAVVFDPSDRGQFDFNGTGTRFSGQQHGELQVVPLGDRHVARNRSTTQRQIVDTAFSAHRVAGERNVSADRKSLKFPLLHI